MLSRLVGLTCILRSPVATFQWSHPRRHLFTCPDKHKGDGTEDERYIQVKNPVKDTESDNQINHLWNYLEHQEFSESQNTRRTIDGLPYRSGFLAVVEIAR